MSDKYFYTSILIIGILLTLFGSRTFFKTKHADKSKNGLKEKNKESHVWGIRITATGFALIVISLFEFLR